MYRAKKHSKRATRTTAKTAKKTLNNEKMGNGVFFNRKGIELTLPMVES
jgi:hypothetical protein